ncbi:CDP-glycerol--UDP-pyrophosphoryl-N-acetylglucosaminyl-N-acetylmannosamine glycerophosphotransferase [Pseudomonas alcaligenes]|uniref:CDP-glycerol--UDP-pyrophosphoryl-N-acetylglucosaminyl-N-acetylmannosamine glycerophosphotransferase n=1 Tax=Aquipseudomonas alcaligenes TaxID=43263 RepID=A0ABR7S4J3_AQUAC|nr:SOS-induced cell division inhibitor SulA [Pseudomonas alcaligenes]MBC9251373.1 CDP-glycerol--UDP-pyrophosphoryl-N-acetylglucosaminyl-N-acetylmannosamine glycerophosphotransferase [Pseudomonas alcaligenes]
MQFPQSLNRSQLPLFEAFLGQTMAPLLGDAVELPWVEAEPFSELSLSGSLGHCRHLLGPVLRELSHNQNARWLTLIAPPASLTTAWLRNTGLNLDRLLVLQPRPGQSALELASEALRLGRSHTVVSWIQLQPGQRHSLSAAARLGSAQSLNIRLD